MRYIKDTSGNSEAIMELIDGLLPLLPGPMENYLTRDGRLNISPLVEEEHGLSHSEQAVADFIVELWAGRGAFGRMVAYLDNYGREVLADALTNFNKEL